jgi:transglutaminase-like putative cysteine protease
MNVGSRWESLIKVCQLKPSMPGGNAAALSKNPEIRVVSKHSFLRFCSTVFLTSLLLTILTSTFLYGDSLEGELQRVLQESLKIVKKAEERLGRGEPVTAETKALEAMAEDVRVIALLLEERFRIRGQKNELQGERAVKRHQEMWERYREVIGEYLRLTDSIQAKDTTGPALSAISQLKKLLRRVLLRKKIPVYGSLPYRHLEYPGRLPKSEPEITPAYKGGDGSVREGDLADTGIAPISEEIAAMAQSLKWNPVNIYEYVKNNIETEWYWGCMKGAEETLRQGVGNDCDQATLLVALFRASGYPARYVRGVIEFFDGGGAPIEKARNLTGVEDPVGIAEYFQKAGIPCEPVIEGGRIVNLRMEHIWAEVLVPYSNYRGAILDEEGKIWLGLDTSIKAAGYEYSSPVDITKDLPLSEIKDRYIGSIQPLTPLEFLRAGIEDYLAQSGSGMHYEDLLMTGRQVAEVMNILPSAMQFREVAITGEYDDMPEELVHKVRFIASRQDTVESIQGNLLEITLPVYRVSSGRVVISYEPETVEDHKII